MTTSLVGFFLDRPSADDAMVRLEAAGYNGYLQDGERFDSKWQQGRIAVVGTAPGGELSTAQVSELRTLLLGAGALEVQDGDVGPAKAPMKQGMPGLDV